MSDVTPKDLLTAVRHALCTAPARKGFDISIYEDLVDYLSQKFQIAIAKNQKQSDLLRDLFIEVTKKPEITGGSRDSNEHKEVPNMSSGETSNGFLPKAGIWA